LSTHINAAEPGEIAESVLMPGDPLRAKYIAENYLEGPVLYSDVRNMYGYTGRYRGVPVSIQGSGMGMPSMGIYSWELMTEYKVKRIIRIGTAGSFHKDIRIGDIVLGISASTDSNYQHSFRLPGNYAPCASWDLLKKTLEINKEMKLSINAGNIVSCDVFYEADPEWWKKWAAMGVMAVEMEAAALYMNAAYNDVDALAMMTITDHFVTGEKATVEERTKANSDMIVLALETAIL
jgi:purine-nucleoside phosphorylase, family 1 (deoD)